MSQPDEAGRMSRREVIRGAALGAVGLGLPTGVGATPPDGEPDRPAPPTGFDFTRQSAALQPDRVVDMPASSATRCAG